MKTPDERFWVHEEYESGNNRVPIRILFGRKIADSGRSAMIKYDLKKRKYISTTSMDAELSLVTANIALAGPGKLVFDPFVGTGSFAISSAHFGAFTLGADIDGRSIKGKGDRNVLGNFKQYGLEELWLGGMASDVTNSPLKKDRWLDAIVCDPPYGIREGCKVLGSKKKYLHDDAPLQDGVPFYLQVSFSHTK
jgi:tRNA (guanine10-N2)-methyltransferase